MSVTSLSEAFGQNVAGHAPPLGQHGVHRKESDGRRVDGHRRRDALKGNPFEELHHVINRVDRDAHTPDLA
jgi:hypothetical protein